jgi:hypothetical protein
LSDRRMIRRDEIALWKRMDRSQPGEIDMSFYRLIVF